MASTDALIRENKRRYEGAVEEINSNLDYSDAAKQRMVSEVYSKARTEHAALAQKVQDEARQTMERARLKAFAPPNIQGADPALVAMSYREAIVRTKETLEVRDLEEILEGATLVGDEVLAKAVLLRGYDLRNERLVSAYLKGRPQEQKLWDSFSERAAEYNEVERMTRLFGTLGPRTPAEMGA
jgi:hypothetical protein